MIWAFPLIFLAAVDPNAPVVDHATVGPEIAQGYETALFCGRRGKPEWLEDCFERVVSGYRLEHSSTDAYELGVSIRAWQTYDADYQHRIRLLESDFDTRGLRARALKTFADLNTLRDKMSLSVDDALKATGDDLPVVRDRWAYWKAELHCDRC